jgi:hypothetical protein
VVHEPCIPYSTPWCMRHAIHSMRHGVHEPCNVKECEGSSGINGKCMSCRRRCTAVCMRGCDLLAIDAVYRIQGIYARCTHAPRDTCCDVNPINGLMLLGIHDVMYCMQWTRAPRDTCCDLVWSAVCLFSFAGCFFWQPYVHLPPLQCCKVVICRVPRLPRWSWHFGGAVQLH